METPRKTHNLRNKHLENVSKFTTPLKLPPSPLMKSLGWGTGVCVYRLDRSPKNGQTRSPWAIKKVSTRIQSQHKDMFNSRLKDEAEILRKLSHPNIVGFRALEKTKAGWDSLALECCETSLGDILEKRNDEQLGSLPAKNILKMSTDISKALDYLHTEVKILHADMKSYNILVKNNFEICKLCDFGVSIPMDKDGVIDLKKNCDLNYIGTGPWCAPEVVDGLDIIDGKADIFSFGLVIYETLALCPPHTLNLTADETELEESKENTNLDESMSDAFGTRPPLPESAYQLGDEYNPVIELFFVCTSEQPEDRPSAGGLVKTLTGMESGN